MIHLFFFFFFFFFDRTAQGAESLIAFLKERGILISVFSGSTLRAVLHLNVDEPGLARTIEVSAPRHGGGSSGMMYGTDFASDEFGN